MSAQDFQPTWDDPIGSNAWNDLSWPGIDGIKESLVSLVAFNKQQTPVCIGTAFLVSSRGRNATCITAAHNLYAGVSRVQYPARHHPSTPVDFIPNFERIDLDGMRLWALYQRADKPEACVVTSVAWDKSADLAVLTIEYRNPTDADFVQGEWTIDGVVPKETHLVGVVGWAEMSGQVSEHPSSRSTGIIGRRLALRVGRVSSVRTNGPMRTGLSIETTIPVFGGMSGGPAFIWRRWTEKPTVFGFVSSDPEDADEATKNDFAIAGRSTVGVLPIQSIERRGTDSVVALKLDNIEQIIIGDHRIL